MPAIGRNNLIAPTRLVTRQEENFAPTSASGSPLAGLTLTKRATVPRVVNGIDPTMAFRETFDTGLANRIVQQAVGNYTIAGGLTYISSGVGWFNANQPLLSPFFAIEMRITTQITVAVGVIDAANANHLMVIYSGTTLALESRAANVNATLGTVLNLTLNLPCTVAMWQMGRFTAIVTKEETGPNAGQLVVRQVQDTGGVLDLTSNATRANYFPGFGLVQNATITNFNFGPYGGCGFQNPNVIRTLDGDPILDQRERLLIAGTSGGLGITGATDVQCTSFGTFALDTNNFILERLGTIAVNNGTKTLGYSVGAIYWDATAQAWQVYLGNWGEVSGTPTNARIFSATCYGNILRGHHVLSGMTQLALPQPSNPFGQWSGAWTGQWDFELLRHNGTYYAVWANLLSTDAHSRIVFAKGTSPSNLTIVSVTPNTVSGTGSDTGQNGYEGPKLFVFAGNVYFTSMQNGQTNPRLHSGVDGSVLGNLSMLLPINANVGGHAALAPIPTAQGGTRWMGMNFTQYFNSTFPPGGGYAWSHGDLEVHEDVTHTFTGQEHRRVTAVI